MCLCEMRMCCCSDGKAGEVHSRVSHLEPVRKLDTAVKTSNLSHKVSSGYTKTTKGFY